ncbi:MAG: hypothetical protein FD147_2638, partial [Chloroflexi bacterium]
FSPIIKLDLMQIDPFVLPEIAAGVKARGLRLLVHNPEHVGQ